MSTTCLQCPDLSVLAAELSWAADAFLREEPTEEEEEEEDEEKGEDEDDNDGDGNDGYSE